MSLPESNSGIHFYQLTGEEDLRAGASLSSGGSIMVGDQNTDALLVAFDPSNKMLWQSTVAESGKEAFNAVAEMPNGDIVACGYTNSASFQTNNQSADILVTRLNSAGAILWSKVLGTEYDDFPFAMMVDSKGDILITGYTLDNHHRTLIFKVDGNGDEVWRQIYQVGAYRNMGKGIIELDNGHYLIAGENSQSAKPQEVNKMQTFLLEIFPNGNLVRSKTFPSYVKYQILYFAHYAIDIIKTDQGYILASFFYDESDAPCAQLLSLSLDYTELNEKRFYGLGAFKPVTFKKLSDGFTLIGSSTKTRTMEFPYFTESSAMLIKLDKDLNEVWQNTLGGGTIKQGSITVSENGTYWNVQGLSTSLSSLLTQIMTYRINSENGELIYEK